MARVRIGVGAGFSQGRLDAALPLIERGQISYAVVSGRVTRRRRPLR